MTLTTLRQLHDLLHAARAWTCPPEPSEGERDLRDALDALDHRGDLELYGGLGTVARACKRVGRESVTLEIDPERAEAARALIAQEHA